MVSLTKLLVTAIILVGIAEASLLSASNVKEPEGKAYYRGTTPNILAMRELFAHFPYFAGQTSFWKAMLQHMQIDVNNDASSCILELDTYLVLYRDLQQSGMYSLDYYKGR